MKKSFRNLLGIIAIGLISYAPLKSSSQKVFHVTKEFFNLNLFYDSASIKLIDRNRDKVIDGVICKTFGKNLDYSIFGSDNNCDHYFEKSNYQTFNKLKNTRKNGKFSESFFKNFKDKPAGIYKVNNFPQSKIPLKKIEVNLFPWNNKVWRINRNLLKNKSRTSFL